MIKKTIEVIMFSDIEKNLMADLIHASGHICHSYGDDCIGCPYRVAGDCHINEINDCLQNLIAFKSEKIEEFEEAKG